MDDVIDSIVDKIKAYDVYDFISRIAGLNLLSGNQNKAVVTDTLIQYIIARPRDQYSSSIKMCDKRFRTIIEELNNSYLTSYIDPCENIFVQNINYYDRIYRVFNGIDITPAYNLQSLINVLFRFKNDFHSEFLYKVNRLFSLLLGLSEELAHKIESELENIEYDESRKVIIPNGETIRNNSDYVKIPSNKIKSFIDGFFSLNDICIDFGGGEKGDLDSRPFYNKPFIEDSNIEELIVLNVSLLPAYALYQVFVWADDYGIKEEVINNYNDYIWLDTRKTLSRMGHKKINESFYGIECINSDYYKDALFTVYNNQLMLVSFLCDDGQEYGRYTIHENYPDNRHNENIKKRLNYFKNNIHKLEACIDDIFYIVIVCSIGRGLSCSVGTTELVYKPISLKPFELKIIDIHERENMPFLPRYIRAKNQLNTMGLDVFSELNSVCIYSSNKNSFYLDDNFDVDEMRVYIAPGDSVDYITEAIKKENRILIDSYVDGEKTEIVLGDKKRNIYYEDSLVSEKNIAFCVVYSNIKLWIVTDIEKLDNYKHINVLCSLLDAISYWMAECKSIIEEYVFLYDVYTIHLSISGEIIEFYYERNSVTPYEKCIDFTVEKNILHLCFKPEAFGNLNQPDNSQEKELCKYILDIIDDISYENRDYTKELDSVFSDPLKKKFFSSEYDKIPYLKPLETENHRIVHREDEDYLSGVIGKELLDTGEWKQGVVDDSQRSKVAHVVVAWLYERLKTMVATFEPGGIIELIYQDLEETLYRLILAEKRYYSDIACYPEKEDFFLKAYNDLNRTSLSLKFLIEFVTAQPSLGKKHFGIGQYEELLAICSMIIEWAYNGDLFHYCIVNTPVEFLKSKRIGMNHNEFDQMFQYNDSFRRRQLRYNSSKLSRKEYSMQMEDFGNELETAFIAEFGYSYSVFIHVIEAMILINDKNIICISKSDLISKIIENFGDITNNVICDVLADITYCPRADFLKLPKEFGNEDAYPWRFNRKYSFNRRPVMVRDDCLIWGNRQLFHMAEYVTELIYSGKFKANSEEMKSLCGRIMKEKGDVFNELIFNMIDDMHVFKNYKNIKKINGKRIAENGCDLGDIDILLIDEEYNKIIVAEVKNFHFSRNPHEIYIEHEKMFVDKENKPSFATKHKKREKWISEHIEDVISHYNLGARTWNVVSCFIVNQPLISQYIFNQNIKCISEAELSVEAIRNL